jgi:hypothetical protein
MSTFGDYPDEMPFDEFNDGVQAFAKGVRAAATQVPTPSSQLAELLATGGVSVNPTKPRSVFMKIKTYVAGLGMATKVVLSAGVAAAATTGAGAAGVLPSPVQNAVGDVVATMTPFELPKGHSDEHHEAVTTGDSDHDEALAPTPTTEPSHDEGDDDHESTVTTAPAQHEDEHPVVTPTTVRHEEPRHEEEHPTTSTTQAPRHEEEHPTTSTTLPAGHGDGDNNNPESIALTCVSKTEPNRVICEWSASSNPDHRRYALLRTSSDSDQGRVVFQTESMLRYEDHDVVAGVTYTYRIVSLRSDGSVESHSNGQTMACC